MWTMSEFSEEDLGRPRDFGLLKRFIPYLRMNRRMLILSMVLMVLLSVLDVALPYVTKIAVDRYIMPVSAMAQGDSGGKHPESGIVYDLDDPGVAGVVKKHPDLFILRESGAVITLEAMKSLPREDLSLLRSRDLNGALLAGLAVAVIALVRFCFGFAQIMVMEFSGQRMMHDLRMRLFAHMQRLPMDYFSKNTVGRLATRVTNDIQNMQEMFTTIITFVMKDVFMLLGITCVLFYMDVSLALAVMAVTPLVFIMIRFFSRKSREAFRTLRLKVAEINAMFSESTGGSRVIQLFTAQERMKQTFQKINHENFKAGMDQIKIYGLFMPVIDLLGSLTLALVIYYGGGRVVTEALSLGTLVAFISYAKMFFRPVRDISEKHNILQNALSSGERIIAIFDKEPAPAGGDRALTEIRSLTFRQVSFAYQQDEPVLKDVSFHIDQGSSLAVLGHTGSGKTSLVSLIMGFYQRDGGDILINGRPMESYSVKGVRDRIALVTQDPYLFSGTIRENILPPDSFLSRDELLKIYEMSHLIPILEGLPKGDETIVSQGGVSLSSGERQLISIARALAHDPDLIILDEATSYVDTESEEKIRLAMAGLTRNRTAITIAHRLRSAMTADAILVLKDGRVVERGDHETLMKNKKLYHLFWHADTNGKV